MVICMDETQCVNLINKVITPKEFERCLLDINQNTNYSNLIKNAVDRRAGKFSESRNITYFLASTI